MDAPHSTTTRKAIRTILLVVLLLVVLTGGAIAADDDVSLESLAEQMAYLASEYIILTNWVGAIHSRVDAIETAIAPTPTPTSTPRAEPCNAEHVKEPPDPHLDCELWLFAYGLTTLGLGYHPSEERLPSIAENAYQIFEFAVEFCGLEPEPLADLIYRAAVRLQRKTGAATPPTIEMLNKFSDNNFNIYAKQFGSCQDAFDWLIGALGAVDE